MLSGTWHKGVWLEFAKAVLFVFAWLLIWGSVRTTGRTEKWGHPGQLGILTIHYLLEFSSVKTEGPLVSPSGFSSDGLIVQIYILIWALTEVDYVVDCIFLWHTVVLNSSFWSFCYALGQAGLLSEALLSVACMWECMFSCTVGLTFLAVVGTNVPVKAKLLCSCTLNYRW